jgi:hypothetical protein
MGKHQSPTSRLVRVLASAGAPAIIRRGSTADEPYARRDGRARDDETHKQLELQKSLAFQDSLDGRCGNQLLAQRSSGRGRRRARAACRRSKSRRPRPAEAWLRLACGQPDFGAEGKLRSDGTDLHAVSSVVQSEATRSTGRQNPIDVDLARHLPSAGRTTCGFWARARPARFVAQGVGCNGAALGK